jgi:hypothetical protein
MSKFIFLAALVLVILAPMGASAATLTETFPDPLGGFYSRWLGANSNMGSVYLNEGFSCDQNFRGNNPVGLWIDSGGTSCGGTGGTPVLTINFNPTFAQTLTSLSFGVEAFVTQQISIYDDSNNLLSTGTFSGGNFGFSFSDIISATSNNGIEKIVFDSTSFGRGQINGNTAVGNFVATTGQSTPEPASFLALGLGLIGLGGLKRRVTGRR